MLLSKERVEKWGSIYVKWLPEVTIQKHSMIIIVVMLWKWGHLNNWGPWLTKWTSECDFWVENEFSCMLASELHSSWSEVYSVRLELQFCHWSHFQSIFIRVIKLCFRSKAWGLASIRQALFFDLAFCEASIIRYISVGITKIRLILVCPHWHPGHCMSQYWVKYSWAYIEVCL